MISHFAAENISLKIGLEFGFTYRDLKISFPYRLDIKRIKKDIAHKTPISSRLLPLYTPGRRGKHSGLVCVDAVDV